MEKAALIPLQSGTAERIVVNSQIFSLGRSLTSSYVMRDMSVSRCHCVLKYSENGWTIQNKSVNKTFVNDQEISNTTYHPLTTNDIIKLTYAVSYKFVFPYDENTSMVSSNKKRKIDNTPRTENNICDTTTKRKTILHNSQEASTSTAKRIDFLQDELNQVRYIKNQFKEENKKLETKLMEKEADVMDKLSSNIKLEQEVIDLKANCAALEKEKEELHLQLTDYECQATLLKLRLDNLTELSTNYNNASQMVEDNNKDGGDSDITEDEADNDIVQSVIKAEISEKELSIKEKLKETINLLKTIRPVKPTKTNKPDILQTITTNLLALEGGIKELALKRNELETNLKTDEKKQNQQQNSTNTEVFTQSKEEFIQVLQNQEAAITDMKEAFKADFLLKFYDTLELDLQCSICHELYIKATCIDCGHIFCRKCIMTWKRQKKQCPTCRKPIKNLLNCISLNSYIDQCYDLLFPDKKEMREKIKQSHEDGASTSTANNNNAAGPLIRAEPIVLSSGEDDDDDDDDNYDDYIEEEEGDYYDDDDDGENSDITDFDSDLGDEGDFDDFLQPADTWIEDDFFVPPPPYGACFICGDPGHWANQCHLRTGT